MIGIFKTNAANPARAGYIINLLIDVYPSFKISVDLEDEDNILRVEGNFFDIQDICVLLGMHGILCIHLPVE